MSSLLARINLKAETKKLKFSELTPKIPYNVVQIKRETYKFGPSICIHLRHENQMIETWLPSRMTGVLRDPEIEELNAMDELKLEYISGSEFRFF